MARFTIHDFDKNVEKLNSAIIQSFKDTILLFGRENTKVISTPGLFPEFPNSDIVDTGELRSSQTIEFDSDTEATISWPKAYALAVHEGATFRNRQFQRQAHTRKIKTAFGRPIRPRNVRVQAHTSTTGSYTIPGRPWTRLATKRFDGGKTMEKLFRRYYVR